MFDFDDIYEFIYDNIKHIIFPEEWLAIDLEMPKPELLALLMLDRHGEVIMSQIADIINIPMSTATGIIDRLVKKGYVIRDRSDSDRRVVAIKLTEKGKASAAKIKEYISGYVRKIYDILTDEERELLFKIITRVMDALHEQRRDTAGEEDSENKVRKIEIE